MIKAQRSTNPMKVLYIEERFAIVTGGQLRVTSDFRNYGNATHACYRAGTIWYLRIDGLLSKEFIYDALEFTLAHDPITSFISEV